MFTKTPFAQTLRLGLATAAAAALTGLAGCADDDMSNMPGMGSVPNSSSSAAPSASSTPAAGPHNDADVTFAQMMIPHHQQAIEMSDMILAKDGIDTSVTDVAGQIKDAQGPEITQMSGWLVGWGEDPSPSMNSDHGGHGDSGMMTQADMDALEQANGADAAKLFLTGMIKHHQGAITMAEQEVDDGENPDAKDLAQRVITSQQAEIDEMNKLLADL